MEPAKGGTSQEVRIRCWNVGSCDCHVILPLLTITIQLLCDVLLVCVGRRPYTTNLGLDKVGVAVDEKGRVKVDGQFKSNIPR